MAGWGCRALERGELPVCQLLPVWSSGRLPGVDRWILPRAVPTASARGKDPRSRRSHRQPVWGQTFEPARAYSARSAARSSSSAVDHTRSRSSIPPGERKPVAELRGLRLGGCFRVLDLRCPVRGQDGAHAPHLSPAQPDEPDYVVAFCPRCDGPALEVSPRPSDCPARG